MYSPLNQGLPNTEGWPWYAIFAISIILNILMMLKGPIQAILPRSTQQYFERKKSRDLHEYLQERGKDELVEELLLRFSGYILEDLTREVRLLRATQKRLMCQLNKTITGANNDEQNKHPETEGLKGAATGGPGLGRVISTLESQKDIEPTEPDTATIPPVE